MNHSEARDLNTLLVWLLDHADEDELPSSEQARAAAETLADAALLELGTGIGSADVADGWHWVNDGYDPDEYYVPVETVRPAGEFL